MYRLQALVATTFLLCAGCSVAPAPVYRAHPVQGSGFWTEGVELARDRTEDVEVVVAFEASRGRWLGFHVELVNRSDRPVTIDPTSLYLRDPDDDGSQPRVHARDPEQAILQADLARSRAVAQEQSRSDTDLLFDFVELSADLATLDETQTDEQRQTEALEDQQEELDDELQRQANERTLRSIDGSKNRWAGKALRKTTVPPGFVIGGEVWFRAPEASREVVVVVPVGEEAVEIAYEVVRYEAQ